MNEQSHILLMFFPLDLTGAIRVFAARGILQTNKGSGGYTLI